MAELKKNNEDTPVKARWRSLFRFTTIRQLPLILVAFVLTIAVSATKIVFAFYLGQLFELFTQLGNGTTKGPQMLEGVRLNIFVLLVIGGASWVLNACFLFIWVTFAEFQVRCARQRLFAKLLDQDLAWFDMKEQGMGSFLSHSQKQLREIQIATAQPLGFLFQHTVQIILAVILALNISWKVALVTMAGIPVSSIIISVVSSRMNPMMKAQQSELAEASKFAYDAFTSIDSVKCLNGEFSTYLHLVSHIQAAARWYLKLAVLTAMQLAFARLTTFAMFVQGFWYGSSLVQSGELTCGDVLTTFWACLITVQSIELGVHQLAALERGKVAGETLWLYLLHPSVDKPPLRLRRDRYPDLRTEDISFQDVSFAYPFQPDRLILKSLNLVFPAGKTVFVVGRSGAGKSTLTNLLLQFYAPTSGGILVGGIPFRAIDTSWIRKSFTIVQQNSYLFNESVSTNILFGSDDPANITSDRMRRCIETASLQNTLNKLPQGLDTAVGVGGKLLSGGQKQRVAVARARMKDSAVLILDEFTSALDFENRVAVMNAVREWRKGMTTIIITHDTTNILDDDLVFVLESGRVADSGLKRDLVRKGLQIFTATETYEDGLESESYTESPSYLDHFFAEDELEESWLASTDDSETSSLIEPVESDERRLLSQQTSWFPQYDANATSDLTESVDFAKGGPFHRQQMANEFLPLGRLARDSVIIPMPRAATHRQSVVPLFSQDAGNDYKKVASKSRHASVKGLRSKRHTFRRVFKAGQHKNEAKQSPPLHKTLLSIPSVLNTKQKILLAASMILATLHAAASPIFSYLLSQLFESFYSDANRSTVAKKWSIGILGLAVCDALITFVMHYLLEYCSQAWMDQLRTKSMRRILSQPCCWFDEEKNHPVQLTICLDQNAEEIRNLAGRFGGLAMIAVMTCIIAIMWSFILNWRLTLVSLACAPIWYGISKGLDVVNRKWEKRTNDLNELVASVFSETFVDVRTVRAFTLENHFQSKHSRILKTALGVGLKRGFYSGIVFGLTESAVIFASSLLFYYAAELGASDSANTTSILSVLTMILFSLGYAVSVMSWIPQVNSANDTATRLIELSRLPSGSSHEHTGKLRVFEPLPIEFKDLSFCYPGRPEAKVLNRISLTIPGNSCVALVGSSGSGKSTIVSLLLGLYACPNPQRGKAAALTLGGVDIRQLHMPTLRTLIAYVPQHPRLFADTIRANITYGLDSYSRLRGMKNVEAAAEAAGIAEFIRSLPEGYSTVVGEGGLSLSGGQIQRLVIARALVRHPRVLILDEATSNLDAESAAVIRQSVQSLRLSARQGLTVILITHAVEMMQIADSVAVIDQGRVVEQGRYQTLLQRVDGRLRDMLGS
ncbi:Mating factor M secretion protein mam1 [Talaromyces islandicus]|uniref:Mating factor M secretion protein mam1 n=1 Tax=Talaromyces islandicus TaxID=28573 RepID=A0A0U1M3I5_TALIS|nr:Mating factor M secretion protein mam1 [Talaromyces islandicus]